MDTIIIIISFFANSCAPIGFNFKFVGSIIDPNVSLMLNYESVYYLRSAKGNGGTVSWL